MSHNINVLKRQFLEYLEIEKGRSLKTIENYDRYLSRFIKQAHINNPSDITEIKVREFRLWLNRQPGSFSRENSGIKKNTQNYYVIGLRTFLKYLISREIKTLPSNKIELAKVGQRDLDLISAQELERLLIAPSGSRENDLRDKAILEVLFSTGLRVSELCGLKIDSIDLSPLPAGRQMNSFSIRGKGGKVRVVFLSPNAKAALRTYLNKRKDIAGESLFGLSPRSIQRLIKHYAIKAGITKKITPHGMRHLFATDLLANGADIRSIQALLGHANIATTQIYTHVTDRQLADVHRAFHGKTLGKR